MQKKKNKEVFELMFVEPFGTGLLLYSGAKFENIKNHLNKNKKISKWVHAQIESFQTPDSKGVVVRNVDTEKAIILFIKQTEKDWDFFETLVHEITHLVENYSRWAHFEEESEFKAYLTESLFRIIRKKIV